MSGTSSLLELWDKTEDKMSAFGLRSSSFAGLRRRNGLTTSRALAFSGKRH